MTPELCLCGAEDCRRCYPLSWRESCADEDDPFGWMEDQLDQEKDDDRESE